VDNFKSLIGMSFFFSLPLLGSDEPGEEKKQSKRRVPDFLLPSKLKTSIITIGKTHA